MTGNSSNTITQNSSVNIESINGASISNVNNQTIPIEDSFNVKKVSSLKSIKSEKSLKSVKSNKSIKSEKSSKEKPKNKKKNKVKSMIKKLEKHIMGNSGNFSKVTKKDFSEENNSLAKMEIKDLEIEHVEHEILKESNDIEKSENNEFAQEANTEDSSKNAHELATEIDIKTDISESNTELASTTKSEVEINKNSENITNDINESTKIVEENGIGKNTNKIVDAKVKEVNKEINTTIPNDNTFNNILENENIKIENAENKNVEEIVNDTKSTNENTTKIIEDNGKELKTISDKAIVENTNTEIKNSSNEAIEKNIKIENIINEDINNTEIEINPTKEIDNVEIETSNSSEKVENVEIKEKINEVLENNISENGIETKQTENIIENDKNEIESKVESTNLENNDSNSSQKIPEIKNVKDEENDIEYNDNKNDIELKSNIIEIKKEEIQSVMESEIEIVEIEKKDDVSGKDIINDKNNNSSPTLSVSTHSTNDNTTTSVTMNNEINSIEEQHQKEECQDQEVNTKIENKNEYNDMNQEELKEKAKRIIEEKINDLKITLDNNESEEIEAENDKIQISSSQSPIAELKETIIEPEPEPESMSDTSNEIMSNNSVRLEQEHEKIIKVNEKENLNNNLNNNKEDDDEEDEDIVIGPWPMVKDEKVIVRSISEIVEEPKIKASSIENKEEQITNKSEQTITDSSNNNEESISQPIHTEKISSEQTTNNNNLKNEDEYNEMGFNNNDYEFISQNLIETIIEPIVKNKESNGYIENDDDSDEKYSMHSIGELIANSNKNQKSKLGNDYESSSDSEYEKEEEQQQQRETINEEIVEENDQQTKNNENEENDSNNEGDTTLLINELNGFQDALKSINDINNAEKKFLIPESVENIINNRLGNLKTNSIGSDNLSLSNEDAYSHKSLTLSIDLPQQPPPKIPLPPTPKIISFSNLKDEENSTKEKIEKRNKNHSQHLSLGRLTEFVNDEESEEEYGNNNNVKEITETKDNNNNNNSSQINEETIKETQFSSFIKKVEIYDVDASKDNLESNENIINENKPLQAVVYKIESDSDSYSSSEEEDNNNKIDKASLEKDTNLNNEMLNNNDNKYTMKKEATFSKPINNNLNNERLSSSISSPKTTKKLQASFPFSNINNILSDLDDCIQSINQEKGIITTNDTSSKFLKDKNSINKNNGKVISVNEKNKIRVVSSSSMNNGKVLKSCLKNSNEKVSPLMKSSPNMKAINNERPISSSPINKMALNSLLNSENRQGVNKENRVSDMSNLNKWSKKDVVENRFAGINRSNSSQMAMYDNPQSFYENRPSSLPVFDKQPNQQILENLYMESMLGMDNSSDDNDVSYLGINESLNNNLRMLKSSNLSPKMSSSNKKILSSQGNPYISTKALRLVGIENNSIPNMSVKALKMFGIQTPSDKGDITNSIPSPTKQFSQAKFDMVGRNDEMVNRNNSLNNNNIPKFKSNNNELGRPNILNESRTPKMNEIFYGDEKEEMRLYINEKNNGIPTPRTSPLITSEINANNLKNHEMMMFNKNLNNEDLTEEQMFRQQILIENEDEVMNKINIPNAFSSMNSMNSMNSVSSMNSLKSLSSLNQKAMKVFGISETEKELLISKMNGQAMENESKLSPVLEDPSSIYGSLSPKSIRESSISGISSKALKIIGVNENEKRNSSARMTVKKLKPEIYDFYDERSHSKKKESKITNKATPWEEVKDNQKAIMPKLSSLQPIFADYLYLPTHGILKYWKKRYVVLTQDNWLHYFTNDDPKQNARVSIPINSNTEINEYFDPLNSISYYIEITSDWPINSNNRRFIVIGCDNKEKCQSWITSIKSLIARDKFSNTKLPPKPMTINSSNNSTSPYVSPSYSYNTSKNVISSKRISTSSSTTTSSIYESTIPPQFNMSSPKTPMSLYSNQDIENISGIGYNDKTDLNTMGNIGSLNRSMNEMNSNMNYNINEINSNVNTNTMNSVTSMNSIGSMNEINNNTMNSINSINSNSINIIEKKQRNEIVSMNNINDIKMRNEMNNLNGMNDIKIISRREISDLKKSNSVNSALTGDGRMKRANPQIRYIKHPARKESFSPKRSPMITSVNNGFGNKSPYLSPSNSQPTIPMLSSSPVIKGQHQYYPNYNYANESTLKSSNSINSNSSNSKGIQTTINKKSNNMTMSLQPSSSSSQSNFLSKSVLNSTNFENITSPHLDTMDINQEYSINSPLLQQQNIVHMNKNNNLTSPDILNNISSSDSGIPPSSSSLITNNNNTQEYDDNHFKLQQSLILKQQKIQQKLIKQQQQQILLLQKQLLKNQKEMEQQGLIDILAEDTTTTTTTTITNTININSVDKKLKNDEFINNN